LTLPENTTLLVIDVQQGLDDPHFGVRNNPAAESNIAALIAAWRQAERPIIHVQHHSVTPGSPLRPEAPGVAVKPEARPRDGELVITKNVNSAFIGTDLEAQLRAAGVDTLVICGLTTEHCVSTTTRMAGNLGFTAYLAADATASHSKTAYTGETIPAEQVYTTALANLHGEFATVMDTAAVIALLEHA
jgi:nicotinamidase-related amidase